jgi:hypothetical protein
MDPALIGVIGVGIGGVLTISGQLLTEGLRGKRERNAEERQEARELQLAARLVMEELAEAGSLIENAATSSRYWPAPRQIPTNTWNQYRTSIAAAINPPLHWRLITSTYDALNDLNWIVQHHRESTTLVDDHRLGVRVSPLDNTREAWRAVRQAIQTLEQTIGVLGPASRVLREREHAEREFWPFGDGDDFNEEDARDADRQAMQDAERREAEQGY